MQKIMGSNPHGSNVQPCLILSWCCNIGVSACTGGQPGREGGRKDRTHTGRQEGRDCRVTWAGAQPHSHGNGAGQSHPCCPPRFKYTLFTILHHKHSRGQPCNRRALPQADAVGATQHNSDTTAQCSLLPLHCAAEQPPAVLL